MPYFNYHAAAKHLISMGKLKEYYYTEKYGNITPALILVFDDIKHPIMPIRRHRWEEYILILPKEKEIKINNKK
ncbi:MAG: thermostable hemolysin delta-VPH [Ruminococcaceae bacterium]|nr:thermostable hemolysin delta-VPH [Oscillospiraceae bacterium]